MTEHGSVPFTTGDRDRAITAVLFVTTACGSNVTGTPDRPPVTGPAGALYTTERNGTAVRVVFAHAYAGSADHWDRAQEHLEGKHPSVAFDFRGHGNSAAPPNDDYSVKSLAADLAAVIDARSQPGEKIVIVGHSMGGSAAIAYAGDHPDRVAGLVLVATPGRTPPEQAKQVLTALEADYDKVIHDYWERLLADGTGDVQALLRRERYRVPRAASLALIRALFEFDPLPPLDRYRGPVLIVDTPQSDVPGSLHSLRPAIPRHLITRASHWPHLDRPDEFDKVLDGFLAQLSPR